MSSEDQLLVSEFRLRSFNTERIYFELRISNFELTHDVFSN